MGFSVYVRAQEFMHANVVIRTYKAGVNCTARGNAEIMREGP